MPSPPYVAAFLLALPLLKGTVMKRTSSTTERTKKLAAVAKSLGTINVTSAIVGLVALAILIVWPKISKKIPGSLIAVIAGVAIVKGFDLEVNTIGDLYQISGGLPRFELPGFSFGLVRDLLPSAFTIAVLAGVESLL